MLIGTEQPWTTCPTRTEVNRGQSYGHTAKGERFGQRSTEFRVMATQQKENVLMTTVQNKLQIWAALPFSSVRPNGSCLSPKAYLRPNVPCLRPSVMIAPQSILVPRGTCLRPKVYLCPGERLYAPKYTCAQGNVFTPQSILVPQRTMFAPPGWAFLSQCLDTMPSGSCHPSCSWPPREPGLPDNTLALTGDKRCRAQLSCHLSEGQR